MPASDLKPSAAADDLRHALAAGDRRRRSRDAVQQMWRVAPVLAAGFLATAAVARFAGWSHHVPLFALAAAATGLGFRVLLSSRARPLSDHAAATIDADASMAGEWRSASWFASRDRRDDWASFHVERAAEHLRVVDWIHLYPAAHAPRARLATAAMVLGALALTLTMPERVGIRPTASASTGATRDARRQMDGDTVTLSPELEQRLAELLAAAESGSTATAETLARNAALREMLNQLSQLPDPQLLEALARALAGHPDARQTSAAQDMKMLADRARKAADSASISRDMQNALEKLADELDIAGAEQARDDDGANPSPGGPKSGDPSETGASGGKQDLSIQFARASDPGGGDGVQMMSGQDDQSGGPPGSGVGGSGSQDAAAGTLTNIEAALKQELVEASGDNPGSNVDTDIRRNTEHGRAAVAFTGAAAATSDRARVTTPPPVPEVRRAGVQTYFVRKPE